MSINYGVTCVNDDGLAITSPAVLAALYAGEVTCSITSGTQVFDFPSVPGGKLYAIQLATGSKKGGGTHTWAISTVSGHARITFAYTKLTYQASATTTLRLFASDTFEPDYGVNAMNDFGERTISTIFPACKFIQRVVLSPTLVAYDGAFSQQSYTLSATANATTAGILFWSLPSSTDATIYWGGDSTVAAGAKAKMHAKLPAGVAPSVVPEGFIFQTGPMTVSTAWGIRVFNGAGQVMFDGATESLKIESRITSLDYTAADTTSTVPTAYTPAIYMPGYVNEDKTGACVDGVASIRTFKGMMRRNGASLFSKQVFMSRDNEGWDCRETGTGYEYGLSTNLFVPVINADRYGGTI